ncbi:hypothetical protein AK812_SmicGene28496 [Symbiodinium microadriaticum]|uniref:Uncharacterized protein n=1 Tax=Symbiodinium microadriaticum TaxID=2951 RepID=A0A1Q9D484_SYMMI|nr:hypothetical protein AK812_SmicGene28496 [Symbiodinium microadriaticum]CAE7876388.1 unnamed protein product [Symbiodinium microadriaticum]CAE7948535.1 unnamed protein product [Symbiodinium sp. KB8]
MQQDEAVDKKIIEVEESTKKDEVEEFEKKLPKIGEGIEEKMTIDGVEVHEESPLKILKDAYRFLGVGVTGSKKVLWDRLKREVASSKLKATIEISKTLEKEFQRQPEMKKDVKEQEMKTEVKIQGSVREVEGLLVEQLSPLPENLGESEIGPIMMMAARPFGPIRRDGRAQSTSGKDPKDPLCISLVLVDQDTKFCYAIPVPRKCSPEFQVEALINAVGTPWDYKQSTLPARQITKRIPPHRGIEVAPQALENLGSDYSPSQVAASDPDSHHIGEQEEQDGRMEEEDEKNEDEDPGEGIGSRSISSMSGVESDHPSNVQVPSEGMTSEELMADGDGRPVESKRAQGSTAMDPLPEPPHARLRTDEPSSQEHMMRRLCRDDVVRRVMVLRTVKEIDSFLKKEFPRYQDDEEVDLAEFGEIEAEIGEDCDGESYGDFGNNDDEEEEE